LLDMNMDRLPVDLSTAECLKVGPDEITVLTTSAQTDGDMFAVEIRMRPGGGPPLMHRHAPSEVYVVRSGEFSFYVGGEDGAVHRVRAREGDVVPLAGGTPHTVRNESDADAVAFVVHTPGAVMEGFSRAAAALAENGSPSIEAVLALATENGVEMLGPIPELVSG
jgi:mannose-6-phosphate isomerase-like protein (cupin superfamily)